MSAWSTSEALDIVAPLFVLEWEIREHTALRPSAMMLPFSLLPGATEIRGLPVIRGDRAALLYEAPS